MAQEKDTQSPEQQGKLYPLLPKDLTPTDANRTRLASGIKKPLIHASGNKRIHLMSPTGLAIAALRGFAGTNGTGEVDSLLIGRESVALGITDVMVDFYSRNALLLQRDLTDSGVINPQERARLNVTARLNPQRANMIVLNHLGIVHEEFLQSIHPELPSPLADIFSGIDDPRARALLEVKSGQLTAIEHGLLLKRGVAILGNTNLSPTGIEESQATFSLNRAQQYSDSPKTVSISLDTRPETLFVGGPGIGTAGNLDSFLTYPRSIFADKSLYVSSIIASLAAMRGRKVGLDSEISDTLVRSSGMENAAAEFASITDVAILSMVHSAPAEIVAETIRTLADGLRSGRALIIMAPDKVYPGETSFETFAYLAEQSGLRESAFSVDNTHTKEYSFKHPITIPGKEIPDRRVSLKVYKK